MLLKKYDLEITAEGNQKLVNYLDVTLNLKEGTFRPYHKPGDQMQHIYRKPKTHQKPLNIYQSL